MKLVSDLMQMRSHGDARSSSRHRHHLSPLEKSATARSRVYLVSSRQYQFFKCGVRLSCKSMSDLLRTNYGTTEGKMAKKAKKAKAKKKKAAKKK